MFKTLLIKNNKKREAALKMKRAGTRNIFLFLLGLIFRTKIVELVCYRNIPLKRE